MSYTGIKWAYSVEGLTGIEKAVLVNFGHRMNDSTGKAWPKKATIAKEINHDIRSVTRAMDVLKDKGLIELDTKRPHSCVYRVVVGQPVLADRTTRPTSKDDSSYLYKNDQRIDNELSEGARKGDDMKADDVAEQFRLKRESITPETLLEECLDSIGDRQKVTPAVLIKYYRALITISYPDTFQAEFTMKQVGMFSQMIKKAGYDLPAVFDVVIPNWIKFAKRVAQNNGLKHTPLRPTLPFLLKYISEGVNFSRAHVCKTTKEEAQNKNSNMPIRKPLPEAPKRKTLSGQAGIDVLMGLNG